MNPVPGSGATPQPSRRWLPHPWLSAMVAGAWLLLQGALAFPHLLWAAILGLVLPWLVDDFVLPALPLRRGALAARLMLVVLWDILLANLAVARLVLDPRAQPQPAWVRVRHSLTDPRAVVLLATIITTTPGTVSCVVDEAGSEILVHALNAPDPAAVAADIAERYEQPLKEIFG